MSNIGTGGQNQDNGWMGPLLFLFVVSLLLMFSWIFSSCSPKIVYQKETVIEYRDRIVHDTTTFEIPIEVEKIVTKDTVSHLENSYAKSDAVVSAGLLHHSLESKPQIIKVPVEIHVTDTLWKESETQTVIEYKEKGLSKFQKHRMNAYWGLLCIIAGLLVFIFRKPIMNLIRMFV